ncbi:hypothetical protein [Chryseobacterium sp. CFBP8996]|uniref:hypothetical protein n=1 Tax=Chryseobacterium sp. CFBP8996 TaxID=3096529 RepID=UPI002A6B0B29|nr:hypothetical protein [Chryseobacterium sp. CFBP8996]MDY0931539.1 hypothetical protein [Chryseobacterium sp. CFBP8996]
MKNKIEKIKEDILNSAASAISTLMQSFDNKEDRLNSLRRINPTPEKDILKRVYNIAQEREDFEACDALKDFFVEKNIRFDE